MPMYPRLRVSPNTPHKKGRKLLGKLPVVHPRGYKDVYSGFEQPCDCWLYGGLNKWW